jgi:hypothetical protein
VAPRWQTSSQGIAAARSSGIGFCLTFAIAIAMHNRKVCASGFFDIRFPQIHPLPSFACFAMNGADIGINGIFIFISNFAARRPALPLMPMLMPSRF